MQLCLWFNFWFFSFLSPIQQPIGLALELPIYSPWSCFRLVSSFLFFFNNFFNFNADNYYWGNAKDFGCCHCFIEICDWFDHIGCYWHYRIGCGWASFHNQGSQSSSELVDEFVTKSSNNRFEKSTTRVNVGWSEAIELSTCPKSSSAPTESLFSSSKSCFTDGQFHGSNQNQYQSIIW